MQKQIVLTGQQMIDMDWYIGDESPSCNFTITIDTTPEIRAIKVHSTEVAAGDYLGWEFDYEETLQGLDDYNHLPCGIFQGNSVVYNDHVTQTSHHIQHAEIAEILGDTSTLELKVYSRLSELNLEVSGFSFTTEPIY